SGRSRRPSPPGTQIPLPFPGGDRGCPKRPCARAEGGRVMGRAWPRVSRRYLGGALVLAVASGLLLHGYVVRAARAGASAGPAVGEVVATRSVRRGEVVHAADVKVRTVPRQYAPPGVLSRIGKAAGRVALSDLV